MKLLALYFDDQVVIPGYVAIAGGTSQHREQSFTADDGWDLECVGPGVFKLSREGMERPVFVGGYGWSAVFEEMPRGQLWVTTAKGR
jgi:hypothetical protein